MFNAPTVHITTKLCLHYLDSCCASHLRLRATSKVHCIVHLFVVVALQVSILSMVNVTDKYPYRLALFQSCLWSHYLFHWRDANFHLFTESLYISVDLLINMIQYLIIVSFIIWYSLCLLYYPRLKSCLKGSVFLVLFVKIIICKCWASCMCYNDMLQEMLMT